MEPIQPIYAGAAGSLPGIRDVAPSPAAAGSHVAPSGLSGVTTAVSEMLSSIGGGLENDQMLKALIALMIIAAMLQQMLEGESSAEQGLRALGSRRGHNAAEGMASSASFVSIQYTSMSVSMTSFNQQGGDVSAGQELGGELDIAT
jgi:hypothetical protein